MDPITLAIIAIATGAAGTIAAEAIILAARTTPRVMGWVKRKIAGNRYLALGPSRAGKSSFYAYMRDDILQGAAEAEPNPTVIVTTSGPFVVDKQGQDSVNISGATDLPGQYSIREQLDLLASKRPNILIVFVSLADSSHAEWVSSFLGELNSYLLRYPAICGNLRAFGVALNKRDLVSGDLARQQEERTSLLVGEKLYPALGPGVDRVKVLTCSLYERRSANEVLLALFRSLSEKSSICQN